MKVIFLLLTMVMTVQVVHASQSHEQPLYENIDKRLSLMKAVALYKHMNQKPVEDPVREKQILNKMHNMAKDYHLKANKVLTFMTVQMSVAKSIQYRHRADFLFDKPEQNPRDLKDIRSDISSITAKIYSNLSTVCQNGGFSKPTQSQTWFDSAVNVEYMKINEKKALFDAMIGVCQ